MDIPDVVGDEISVLDHENPAIRQAMVRHVTVLGGDVAEGRSPVMQAERVKRAFGRVAHNWDGVVRREGSV